MNAERAADTVVTREPHEPGPTALERVVDLGGAAQACIPGLYAWGVTVAPVAWAHGASALAKVTALLGLASLGAALVIEHRRPEYAPRARAVAVWGLAIPSALTWAVEPAAMSLLKIEAARGFAGMLGWGLFAFACAAPPVRRDAGSESRIVEGPPLRPRTRLARGDVWIVSVGAVIAGLLQLVGWRSGPAERAVLVRLVAIACGLTILGAATGVALARHVKRVPAGRRERLRRALPWLVLASLLAVARVALLVFTGK